MKLVMKKQKKYLTDKAKEIFNIYILSKNLDKIDKCLFYHLYILNNNIFNID